MKLILPFILILLSSGAYSQTVSISGRCYYDVNGNYIFDGSDSVLANRLVSFQNDGGVYNALTDAGGQYSLFVPVDTFDVNMAGPFDFRNYKDTAYQRRIYTVPGADIVNFAYQKRDSIEQVNANIALPAFVVPPSGGTRQFKLEYSYDGLLQSIPASVTLRHSSKLTLVNSSFPPSVTGSGFLQWNFASTQRNVFDERPRDSILLTFSFPAVGDTIGSFVFEPKFVPVIAVTKPYRKYNFNYEQEILHPASLPIGPTSGVKWLRQYNQTTQYAYDYCNAIDTAKDGTGYLIAGSRYLDVPGPGPGLSGRFVYIAKLNRDGLSVWEKYIDTLADGSIIDYPSAIKHTSDGGCLVLGTSRDSSYLYSYDVVMLKLDATGNIVWTKKMQGSGYDDAAWDFAVLPDGSSIIAGSTYSNNGNFTGNTDTLNGNIFIAKFSATGNILFTKIYGGSRYEYANRLVALQNGSFLVLASTESNNGDVVGAHQHFTIAPNGVDTVTSSEAWVLNVNGNGGMIWNRCYGGRKNSYIAGAADNAGGILLTGTTDSKDGDLPYYPEASVPLWALQVSGSGAILWSKLHKLYKGYQDSNYVLPPNDSYYAYTSTNLRKTKDGNFAAGIMTFDKYGAIKAKHGGTDLSVVKLNTTGDIVWQKAIGGTNDEYVNDIVVDNNDDILFAGSTYSGNDDLYQPAQPNSYPELMMVGKLGITNIIKGQVFIDNNGNHVKDAGEMYYSQGRISSIKNTDTVTARIFDGQYLSNVDTGNYVTTYKPANNYYTVFPASHNSGFAGFDLKDSVDFALAPKPNVNDLEVQLLPLNTPRPGFDVAYRVITKNAGTTTMNNVVVGFKNDSRLNYTYASRTENGNVADSVWWGPFTLNAFDIDTLYINFTLDAPPTLNNGDTISSSVTANPVVNDSSAANNVATLREIVRGSFDPNDKTEAHGGTLTTTQYAGGEYLQYLIRFQNTGTDTAFFITVKDTLQAKLDLSTLEVISASHPFVFRLNGNVATWDFKKINLPDSTTDEPGSHGFILFKVKPKTGLAAGDEFTNNAAIYFDYNLPVITNQDKTTIGSNNGVCPNGNVSYTAGLTGTAYQWQVNTGSGYTNLSNGGIYSGVNTGVLTLTGAPTSMYGYRYRCIVNGGTISPENVLRFAVQWTGAAGTAWENTANWDCGSLPDAKTEVIIPAGVNYPQLNSNRSCYSLRLSPGSSVTVTTGFTLTITGKAN
jgi:hypothetical protein